MARIFVSYSRADGDLAPRLATSLRVAGQNVWFDTAELHTGSWRTEIARAIEACDVFLLFASERSLTRPVVHQEITLAQELSKSFVIVTLCEPEVLVRSSSALILAGKQLIDGSVLEYDALLQRVFAAMHIAGFADAPAPATQIGASNAKHQRDNIWPQFDPSRFSDRRWLEQLCAEFAEAVQLKASNAYNWINLGILRMHLGRAEGGLDACITAHKLAPDASDAAHYRNVAELYGSSARKLSLAQVESIESRSLSAFDSTGDGRNLLPAAVIASDYRARFGFKMPHGAPGDLLARARRTVRNVTEMDRFFFLIKSSLAQ